VIDGKHAATLLNTPFDLQAVDRGMNRLGSAGQLMGSYPGPRRGCAARLAGAKRSCGDRRDAWLP
jgi:hypothetical protein